MTQTVNIVMDKAVIGPFCTPTSIDNRQLPQLMPLGVAIEWVTDKDTFQAPLSLQGDQRSLRNVVMDGRDVFGIQSSPARLEDTLFELYRIGVFQRPIRELLEDLSQYLTLQEDFPMEDMPDLEEELSEAGYKVGEVVEDPDNPLVAHVGLTWGSANQNLQLNGPQFTFEDSVGPVPHELKGIGGLLTKEFKQSPEWFRAVQLLGRSIPVPAETLEKMPNKRQRVPNCRSHKPEV